MVISMRHTSVERYNRDDNETARRIVGTLEDIRMLMSTCAQTIPHKAAYTNVS